MSLRFDQDRPRSSVPAGPLRGIMPRPVAVRGMGTPPPPPQATAPQSGGTRPMPVTARPTTQRQSQASRGAYGGRGDPPPPGSGWNACLDWAAFGGFDSDEDRALAYKAWSGTLVSPQVG